MAQKIHLVFIALLLLLTPQIVSSETQAPLEGSVGQAILTDESFEFPDESFNPEAPVVTPDEFFKAKISAITSQRLEKGYDAETPMFIQELTAEILEGVEEGKVVPLVNEIPKDQIKIKQLSEGDIIIIGKTTVGGDVQYYLNDVYRLNALWIVIGLFIGITLIFTKTKGIRAFLGLAISFLVITLFMVPQILKGSNPLLISLISTVFIAATSLYIAHGFHRRTTIAFGGTIISIVLALIFSYAFVKITKLFGMGTEEAFFLQFVPGGAINLQGLLLGGIIIGVLGILDDITTAQAAVVEQIHDANPELNTHELYKRGSIVGREHILSLVNTLVLAYTGASLPLLLLFKVYERPMWITLNSEIIMEEVIRMLIGSITLILAVPITTLLAARYYSHTKPGKHGDTLKPAAHLHVH